MVRQHDADRRSRGALNPARHGQCERGASTTAGDWTQNNDLAAADAGQAQELGELFIAEAAKNRVLPLDNSVATRVMTPRRSPASPDARTSSSAFPVVGNPGKRQPNLLASYKLRPRSRSARMAATACSFHQGGRSWRPWLLHPQGKPVYAPPTLLDPERVRWEAPQLPTAGKHVIEFDLDYSPGFATFAFNSRGVGQPAEGVSPRI